MNKYTNKINSLHGEFTYNRRESLRTLNEEQIRDAERQVGYTFPSDYREFIRDFGGFRFFNVSPLSLLNYSLRAFYGLDLGDHLDLLGMRGFLFSEHIIAPEMLPIARDAANNNFLLFLDGEYKGSVYFLSMDESTTPFTYVEEYRLSSSFDEFIQSLILLPEE